MQGLLEMGNELKTYAHFSIEAKDLKMLRESLCIAQNAVYVLGLAYDMHQKNLQQLIDEIDKNRPLGSDGKHGNLHTHTCGCEDLKEEVNGTGK